MISPNTRFEKCPQWPTMQWLAEPVVDRLDGLVGSLHEEGIEVGRSDVVGALVLDRDPADAKQLWDLIRPFKREFARPPRRSADGARPVKLVLPSPISLRIDGLVEWTRERATVYRHDLIGALIMKTPRDSEKLAPLLERYVQARAGQAALPGRGGKARVLREEAPSPGPRPRHAPRRLPRVGG